MRSILIAAITAIAMACSTAAIAQPADNVKPKKKKSLRNGPYLGVQPGMQDVVPHAAKARSRGAIRQVTWVGFQMAGQGGRVFIQATEPPEYSIVPGDPNEVVLELTQSRLHSRNDGRPLETGWFPTAVASIDANQLRGNKVRVAIKLREVVGYDLRQEGNYLFLDFRPPTGPIKPPALPKPADG